MSDSSSLSVVVCAAPLAERASEVAAVLVRAGWDVTVVVTPAARSWLDEDAVRRETGRPVSVDYRERLEPKRGPRPDAAVVCPLTFNTLNKLAAGVSDTYALGVLNEALGAGHPFVAVPIVNEQLWGHPVVARNIELLGTAGVSFLDPHTGRPGALPVRSGTGAAVAAAFDPAWLLRHLTRSPAA